MDARIEPGQATSASMQSGRTILQHQMGFPETVAAKQTPTSADILGVLNGLNRLRG